jgi:molybdate transport system substrate-binding protein
VVAAVAGALLLSGGAAAGTLTLARPSAAAGALDVSAATSLAGAMPEIERDAAYAFGASNTLRLQIERGAPADLFLSADPGEAEALHRAGRCRRPETFATNKLVLIVREGDPRRIGSVAGLRRGGLNLSVGSAAAPIGGYTRRLLARLRIGDVLTSNDVSRQPNVGQVLSQVAFGGADAGFVYATDVRAQADRVDALGLPHRAQPAVRYQGCVVVGDGADTARAQALLDAIRSAHGRGVLRRLGFGPAPEA